MKRNELPQIAARTMSRTTSLGGMKGIHALDAMEAKIAIEAMAAKNGPRES
jgi:hypothetical protein